MPVYYTNLHKIILSVERVALDMDATRRHRWNLQHNWLACEWVDEVAQVAQVRWFRWAVVGGRWSVHAPCYCGGQPGCHDSQNGHLLADGSWLTAHSSWLMAHAFELNAFTICVSDWSNQQVKFTKVRWHNWVDSLTIYWFSIRQSWPTEGNVYMYTVVAQWPTHRFSCYRL